MLHLILVVVPLGLAAAVSPVMLAEQTVLLAAPGGRRTPWLYAAGTTAVLVLLVTAVLLLGHSLSLPGEPHLDATLDLWIGAGLLALAGVVHLARAGERGGPPRQRHLSPPAAFGFGAVAMATDVTTLALVTAAARELAAGSVADWERLVVGALLVALAGLPAWGPVALAATAPHTASRVLDQVESFLRHHGRAMVVLFLAAGGALLVGRGLLRLSGL